MAETKKYRLVRGKHTMRHGEPGRHPGISARQHVYHAGMEGNDVVELTEAQYGAFKDRFEPYGATKSARTRSKKAAADKGKKKDD